MIDYEKFIPGLWVDEINVNDFVNLNLQKYKGNQDFLEKVQLKTTKEDYNFLSDENNILEYFPQYIPKISNVNKKHLEQEDFFSFIHTTEIKKMLSISLIREPYENNSFIQPDIRSVVLYGTRTLINDKKHYLKSLEKQLQTTEWFQRRINLHQSINSLYQFEDFCENYNISVKKPAESVKKSFQYTYLSILFAKLESRKTSFSLTNIFNFLDILIEQELKNKTISELEVQKLIEEFFLKLIYIKKMNNNIESKFDLSETLHSKQITKTTYRMLSTMLKYRKIHNIGLQLILEEENFPETAIAFLKHLLNSDLPITVTKQRSNKKENNSFLTPFNAISQSYNELYFQKGSCDLLLLYKLALNGGKEPRSNTNLQTITKPFKKGEISFEESFAKYEAFIRYFITLYTEYINSSCYYEDIYHTQHFKNALINNYPYYVMNINFYNLNSVVSLLSSIYQGKCEFQRDAKGWIIGFTYDINLFEEFILTKLINIIKEELDKMLFYKNGKYNLSFFDGTEPKSLSDNNNSNIPFYIFLNTDYIGKKKLYFDELKNLLENFKKEPYTILKLYKK